MYLQKSNQKTDVWHERDQIGLTNMHAILCLCVCCSHLYVSRIAGNHCTHLSIDNMLYICLLFEEYQLLKLKVKTMLFKIHYTESILIEKPSIIEQVYRTLFMLYGPLLPNIRFVHFQDHYCCFLFCYIIKYVV